MTRGRRKDLSIPPSRALLQQRDYRARKAQYVADLEDRVRRTDEENARLRKEIETLRMRAAAPPATLGPSPEVVTASSELMHQLTSAASCLARFQQLTFSEQHQAQAAAQAHALAQAQMQTQNLHPLPHPHELTQGPELPPIRTQPSNESQILPGPSAVFGAPSRHTSPPRTALHPSRHQHQHQPPPLTFHHHHLSSPPPLHVPSSADSRRDHFSVLHPSHADTPRQTPVPSSSSASSSTSVSTSPSALHSRIASSSSSTAPRASSYTGYNEIESAWGYFDSRDLGVGDEDEEDELLDEDDPRMRGSMHRHHAHSSHVHRAGPSSSRMSPRTSEMRSTNSSSSTEDTPMRMREEDTPMGTR